MFEDLTLANFLSRKKCEKFRHAVSFIKTKNEKEMLPLAVKTLIEWAGEQLWKEGYDIETLKTTMGESNWGLTLGVGVDINAVRDKETVRQLCYQFVRLAEATRKNNELLAFELAELKNSFFYKAIQFFKNVFEIKKEK